MPADLNITPSSFTFIDVDNLSNFLKNVSVKNDINNLNLRGYSHRHYNNTYTIYTKTKVHDMGIANKHLNNKENDENKTEFNTAIESIKKSFTELFKNNKLDPKSLDLFFSNIALKNDKNPINYQTITGGDLLKLCDIAKNQKALHLSKKANCVLNAIHIREDKDVLDRIKITHKDFLSVNDTIPKNTMPKNTLSLDIFTDAKNFINLKVSLIIDRLKLIFSTKTNFYNYDSAIAKGNQVQRDQIKTSGQSISQNVMHAVFPTLEKNKSVIVLKNTLTLSTINVENKSGSGMKTLVTNKLAKLDNQQTALFSFNHSGHWMLISARNDFNNIHMTAISTSKGNNIYMQNILDSMKDLVPKNTGVTTEIIEKQVQNKTGSSCGAYVFDLASRIVKNNGFTISAFNELCNETADLSYQARKSFEVNELRKNLLDTYNSVVTN